MRESVGTDLLLTPFLIGDRPPGTRRYSLPNLSTSRSTFRPSFQNGNQTNATTRDVTINGSYSLRRLGHQEGRIPNAFPRSGPPPHHDASMAGMSNNQQRRAQSGPWRFPSNSRRRKCTHGSPGTILLGPFQTNLPAMQQNVATAKPPPTCTSNGSRSRTTL